MLSIDTKSYSIIGNSHIDTLCAHANAFLSGSERLMAQSVSLTRFVLQQAHVGQQSPHDDQTADDRLKAYWELAKPVVGETMKYWKNCCAIGSQMLQDMDCSIDEHVSQLNAQYSMTLDQLETATPTATDAMVAFARAAAAALGSAYEQSRGLNKQYADLIDAQFNTACDSILSMVVDEEEDAAGSAASGNEKAASARAQRSKKSTAAV